MPRTVAAKLALGFSLAFAATSGLASEPQHGSAEPSMLPGTDYLFTASFTNEEPPHPYTAFAREPGAVTTADFNRSLLNRAESSISIDGNAYRLQRLSEPGRGDAHSGVYHAEIRTEAGEAVGEALFVTTHTHASAYLQIGDQTYELEGALNNPLRLTDLGRIEFGEAHFPATDVVMGELVKREGDAPDVGQVFVNLAVGYAYTLEDYTPAPEAAGFQPYNEEQLKTRAALAVELLNLAYARARPDDDALQVRFRLVSRPRAWSSRDENDPGAFLAYRPSRFEWSSNPEAIRVHLGVWGDHCSSASPSFDAVRNGASRYLAVDVRCISTHAMTRELARMLGADSAVNAAPTRLGLSADTDAALRAGAREASLWGLYAKDPGLARGVFQFDQQLHHLAATASSLRLGDGSVEYRAVGSEELVGRFDPSRPLGRDWDLIRLQEAAPGEFVFARNWQTARNCWEHSREGRARALWSGAIRLHGTNADCPYTPLNTPNIELVAGVEVLEYPRYHYQDPEILWACAPGFEGPEWQAAIIRMGFYAYYLMRLPSVRPDGAPTLGGGC